ncbi:MAG: hypothetical protein AAF907_13700, partial [Planctomycetota bacterium]
LEAVVTQSDRPKRYPLPDGFPIEDAGEPVRPSALAERFGDAADAIETKFNARNGNDAFTRRRAASRAFAEGG